MCTDYNDKIKININALTMAELEERAKKLEQEQDELTKEIKMVKKSKDPDKKAKLKALDGQLNMVLNERMNIYKKQIGVCFDIENDCKIS